MSLTRAALGGVAVAELPLPDPALPAPVVVGGS